MRYVLASEHGCPDDDAVGCVPHEGSRHGDEPSGNSDARRARQEVPLATIGHSLNSSGSAKFLEIRI